MELVLHLPMSKMIKVNCYNGAGKTSGVRACFGGLVCMECVRVRVQSACARVWSACVLWGIQRGVGGCLGMATPLFHILRHFICALPTMIHDNMIWLLE